MLAVVALRYLKRYQSAEEATAVRTALWSSEVQSASVGGVASSGIREPCVVDGSVSNYWAELAAVTASSGGVAACTCPPWKHRRG